ncbi:aminoglycoside phosphotransferase family protein [Paenibacillus barcinonensis]|uniref:Aminoglycoside phosphotransferase (APT) family kinase protein n=1 Tax=Paenibacillus barcinonensis TaxID=198119 RepID=A0A2V4WIY5_PAEBA|nr:aminoglycoside phosphotransferase family protein [Paenibacillus barcinonensis]PYE47494.1 aminoglycoside phosphotransferase (APT) family kinase protein [Paenibacillus barcinonensis]QKS56406.1 aminoglycoside phosphotransferase family protein [Paenibacillus barcinonensis]
MESTYKTRLSQAQLNEIVRHHLAAQIQSCEELIDGWANQAYNIKLSGGENIVLKIAPSAATQMMRCEQDLMTAEVQALRLVAKLGDVPVPKVLVYDDSLTKAPAPYFIMEFMSGVPYNQIKAQLTQEEQDGVEQQLGVYNRRINEIKGEQFGYFSGKDRQRATWREAFLMLMEDMLADGEAAEVEIGMNYDALRRLIEGKSDALDEVTESVLISWDLWDGNVLVQDNQITGIIDFERSLWGDPLMEHYFSHFNYTPGFVKGYGRALTTENEQKRRSLYDLYFDLALRIECNYRQYDNQDHIQWTIQNMEEGIARFQNS